MLLGAAAIGGLASAYGASKANQANKESTQKQMDFQKEMSNTAHQREVKDLQAAGLNPMLSAKLGGASTPTGSSYTSENVGASAAQGASSALQAAQAYKINDAQVNLINSQAEAASAQAARTRAETPNPDYGVRKGEADLQQVFSSTAQLEAATQKVQTETERTLHDIENIKADTDQKRTATGKMDIEVAQIFQNMKESMARIEAMGYNNAQTEALTKKYVQDTLNGMETEQVLRLEQAYKHQQIKYQTAHAEIEENKLPASRNTRDAAAGHTGRAADYLHQWLKWVPFVK